MGCSNSKEQAPPSAPKSPLPSSNDTHPAAPTQFHEPSVVFKGLPFALKPREQVKGNVRHVAHHLRNIFATPLDAKEMSAFSIQHHPKSEADQRLIQKALKSNFVFEHLALRELQPLVLAFELQVVEKDQAIINQGDTGEYFYIIQQGSVIFQVNGKEVGRAPAGASFGELALLYSCPRAATVVAAEQSQLFRVDQTTFRFILRKQTEEGVDQKMKLLRNVPFLHDLAELEIMKLADVMTPYKFTKDQVIFKKGDVGDNFYIVEEGTLLAKNIGLGQSKYEDMEIGPGAYAGERAIITGDARAADLIAMTDGMAFIINKDTFAEVLGKLEDVVLRSNDVRQLAGMRIILDSGFNTKTLQAMAKMVTDRTFKVGETMFSEGKSSPAAVYLIRSGKIKVTKKDGSEEVFERGGYIGHETLMADTEGTGSDRSRSANIVADFTATVLEECTCGVLTLVSLRRIVNTRRLGQMGASVLMAKEDIKLSDLKKHALLGAGTFGQVWLVSNTSRSGSVRKQAYALKIQSKYELCQDGQAQAVMNEKNIMASIDHPFIIKLVTTYKDAKFVYMLMEIVQGGELYQYIHSNGRDGIPENDARFYAACISEGLAYMHRLQIVYRDLKPENVLVDQDGYCVIVDLGFAKVISDKTYTLCGTPLYLAPEIILNRGHSWSADHFSLGVLIYEMIFGRTPFFEDGMEQMDLFRAIVKGRYRMPSNHCSPEVAQMIKGFLQNKPNKRLGSLKGGENDIYAHPWFRPIDFEQLCDKQIKAPKVPKISNPLDTSNFEDWSHLEDSSRRVYPKLTPEQELMFNGF